MDFAKPENLYLLILVVFATLLVQWAERRRKIDIALLGAPALIEKLSSSLSKTRRRWKTVFWFTALVALIVASARPRWGTQIEMTTQRGLQVMAVLDVSASMLAEDVMPNRLTRAKLTLEELMGRLSGSEVGLVLFAGAAFIQFPLTVDLNTARTFLRAAGPEAISRPGTALEEALRVAINGFPERYSSNRVILLLTDGEGHEGDPLGAADAAANSGTIVNAIGFGSPKGEPIPLRDGSGNLIGYKKDAQGQTVLSRLDETALHQIVNRTGGQYFRASAGGEEIAAITEAMAELDTDNGEGQFETRRVEHFEWFAVLALLAFTVELLVSDRSGSWI